MQNDEKSPLQNIYIEKVDCIDVFNPLKIGVFTDMFDI